MHQGPLDDQNEITSLSDIMIGEKYSGFGVILDSTRAIRVNSRQAVEYSTQIKIIDKSMNPALVSGQTHSKGYVTFFMFWTSEENQPFAFKIGDIIRFNHFEFERFKGYLQGKNKKGASWCIYHGDSPNNDPYCQSNEYKEKMTQFHVQKLHEYRQWSTAFFQQNSLRNLDWYSYERHLDNPSVLQTFDMMLRVEEIRLPSDETTGLLLILLDNKMKRYQTHVSPVHGKFLKEGEIVKLRSIEAVEGDYLKGNARYFAVLGIPSHYRDAQEFVEAISIQESQEARRMERMEEETGEDLNQMAGQYNGFDPAFFTNRGVLLQGGSRLSSAVLLRRKELPKNTAFETLKELESQDYEKIMKENHKFHMRLTLIDIRPKSLMQALRNECRNCKLIRRLDAPEGETCCSRKMEKTMLLRLLWQDQSLKTSKKLLITYVAPGDDYLAKCIFPELPLKQILSGELESYEKTWEEIVERYLEDDRLFDILAEPFDNILLKESDLQVPLRLTETMFVPVLQ